MSDCYLGEIRIFAGNYAPVGWELCDGRSIPITNNEALYALIGVTYGGDGKTSFNLPNLNQTLPIGQGQGVGLTNRTMAQRLGDASATLTTAMIPPHLHTIFSTKEDASSVAPGTSMQLAAIEQTPSASNFYDNGAAAATAIKAFSSKALSTAGSSQPHENRMPSLALTYIIATNGIFPTSP
ncbi:phage tail protein [Undibacterium sp. CY7W]|uniref:Phage tail protein n=1 Tax=Undibacterium rugosum TaxID=2762291 RepID=A0A923I2W2_9BURK|nr:tail fiber protein [Undibacterium rugosum]MBC3936779.1 phage tail protein [Undibacterium rugosum]